VDRYSFLVRLLHPLLHAGLSRRTNIAQISTRPDHVFAGKFILPYPIARERGPYGAGARAGHRPVDLFTKGRDWVIRASSNRSWGILAQKLSSKKMNFNFKNVPLTAASGAHKPAGESAPPDKGFTANDQGQPINDR